MSFIYLFISLDRCDGTCNTAQDRIDRVCIPDKLEGMNFRALIIIKGISK